MSEQRPVGWHADLEANRYRYWDGERWAFTASATDLAAYREVGQVVTGVDFDAPTHSELPPERKPGLGRTQRLIAAAAAVVVLVGALLILL